MSDGIVTGDIVTHDVVGGQGTPAYAYAGCLPDCDGGDPGSARGDRLPVDSATLFGRVVTLQVSDPDNTGWATIDNAAAGDEVWLDRTWDGGFNWDGKVGDTVLAPGDTAGHTLMYGLDDDAIHRVSGLRACGKAGDRPDIMCTSWARSTVNAGTRVDAAATALMGFYNHTTGTWPSAGWWNGANALTALIDYSSRTGSTAYRYAIARTYDLNRGRFLGDFRNEYIDDSGWRGLAWIRAYDLTGDRRYLETARIDADYMHSYWDAACGGGVWWSTARTYKNAITNEQFINLSAALHWPDDVDLQPGNDHRRAGRVEPGDVRSRPHQAGPPHRRRRRRPPGATAYSPSRATAPVAGPTYPRSRASSSATSACWTECWSGGRTDDSWSVRPSRCGYTTAPAWTSTA
jgi:hypothetical protein